MFSYFFETHYCYRKDSAATNAKPQFICIVWHCFYVAYATLAFKTFWIGDGRQPQQRQNKQPIRTDKWPLEQYDCISLRHLFHLIWESKHQHSDSKNKMMNRKHIPSKSDRRGQCCRFYTEGVIAQSVPHICLNPGIGLASEISNRHSKVSIIQGLRGGQGVWNYGACCQCYFYRRK